MSMRAVEMPIDAAMRRFWVTARICRPKDVARSTSCSADEDERREHDDPEPVGGDRQAADLERARHERRIADQAVVGAEHGAHQLLQDQRHAPGREQRFERAGVEKADHQTFDRDADRARNDKGEREWRRRATNSATRAAGSVCTTIGRIGAEHHHFAMRHVDDAHDAEGDREANRREQQDRRGRNAVPEVLRHVPYREAGVDRAQSAMRRRSSPPGRWPSGRSRR